jgi:hypothetical protein
VSLSKARTHQILYIETCGAYYLLQESPCFTWCSLPPQSIFSEVTAMTTSPLPKGDKCWCFWQSLDLWKEKLKNSGNSDIQEFQPFSYMWDRWPNPSACSTFGHASSTCDTDRQPWGALVMWIKDRQHRSDRGFHPQFCDIKNWQCLKKKKKSSWIYIRENKNQDFFWKNW